VSPDGFFSGLELAPGLSNSAVSLSWPYPDPANELVNSYLKARVLNHVAASIFVLLGHGSSEPELTKRILEVDYRTTLINRSRLFEGMLTNSQGFDSYYMMRVVRGSIFRYIPPLVFDDFDLKLFRQVSLCGFFFLSVKYS
jgi:hypothetical protein